MARIEPSKRCAKCGGLLAAQASATRVTHACKACDKPDPTELTRRWVSGELKPPSR